MNTVLVNQIRFRAMKHFESGEFLRAVSEFGELLSIADSPFDRSWRATCLASLGRYREALYDCEIAMTSTPPIPAAFLTASFIRSSSPVADMRNGSLAVELVKRAVAIIDGPLNWQVDTLVAAAHAEAGDFDSAESILRKLLTSIPSELKSRIELRIKQYSERTPYVATIENNVSGHRISKPNCIRCGKQAILTLKLDGTGNQPYCVDCYCYETN